MEATVHDTADASQTETPPKALPVKPDGIPAELKVREQWVCWSYAMRDGKWTKVPETPRGEFAKANDPSTWSDFDIVMCNMITSIFLPLLGELRSRLAPTGVAVFSGLLATEIESVSGALVETGFAIPSHRTLGEWASLVTAAATVP